MVLQGNRSRQHYLLALWNQYSEMPKATSTQEKIKDFIDLLEAKVDRYLELDKEFCILTFGQSGSLLNDVRLETMSQLSLSYQVTVRIKQIAMNTPKMFLEVRANSNVIAVDVCIFDVDVVNF